MYPAKFLGVSRIYLTLYIIYFIFKYGWAKEYFFCGGGGGGGGGGYPSNYAERALWVSAR